MCQVEFDSANPCAEPYFSACTPIDISTKGKWDRVQHFPPKTPKNPSFLADLKICLI